MRIFLSSYLDHPIISSGSPTGDGASVDTNLSWEEETVKDDDKFMSDLNITINQLEKDSSAALSSNGIEMVDDLLMGDETAHKKRTVDESNASAESGGIMRRVFVAGSIPSDYIAQLPGKIGQQILDQSAGDASVQRDMLNYYVNEELKKLPVLDQIRVLDMPESEKIPTLLSLLEKMLVVGDY